MYTYNRIAKDFYLNFGGVQTTVPLELNYKEIEFRGLAGDEMIVYGYMPAMISAGCGLKPAIVVNQIIVLMKLWINNETDL